MRSMRISALTLAAVLTLCGSGLVRADGPATQPTTRPHGEHRGPIMEALKATTPAITDAEKAQIKPIMEAARAKMEAWYAANKDQLQTLHADMKAAVEAGDKEKMKSIHAQIEALGAPKPKETVDQILPLLTADQQTSFKAAIEAIMKEHRGPGGHGGPGHNANGGAAPAQQ